MGKALTIKALTELMENVYRLRERNQVECHEAQRHAAQSAQCF